MWIIYVVAGAFFAALVAIAYFGFQENGDRLLGEEGSDARADGDCCGTCSAPLRRGATREEIVFEIEHRIHADLRDVSHALRAGAERAEGTARA